MTFLATVPSRDQDQYSNKRTVLDTSIHTWEMGYCSSSDFSSLNRGDSSRRLGLSLDTPVFPLPHHTDNRRRHDAALLRYNQFIELTNGKQIIASNYLSNKEVVILSLRGVGFHHFLPDLLRRRLDSPDWTCTTRRRLTHKT